MREERRRRQNCEKVARYLSIPSEQKNEEREREEKGARKYVIPKYTKIRGQSDNKSKLRRTSGKIARRRSRLIVRPRLIRPASHARIAMIALRVRDYEFTFVPIARVIDEQVAMNRRASGVFQFDELV